MESINHPSHYQGSIECIDGLESILAPEQFEGFLLGNALKYLWRAGKKGDKLEDYRKAQWYLDKLVKKESDKQVENRVKKVLESVADMVGKAQDELRGHGWQDLQNNDIWESANPMQMTVVHYPPDDKKHEEEFRRQEIKQEIMDERDYDNPEIHVPD